MDEQQKQRFEAHIEDTASYGVRCTVAAGTPFFWAREPEEVRT